MTELLERAVAGACGLPPDMQDEIACLVLLVTSGEDQPPVELTPEEAAFFDESFAQAVQCEFASDEEIRAIWAKHE